MVVGGHVVVGPVMVGMVQHLVHFVEPGVKFEWGFQVIQVSQELQGVDAIEAELAGGHDIIEFSLNVCVYHLLKYSQLSRKK